MSEHSSEATPPADASATDVAADATAPQTTAAAAPAPAPVTVEPHPDGYVGYESGSFTFGKVCQTPEDHRKVLGILKTYTDSLHVLPLPLEWLFESLRHGFAQPDPRL